MKHSLTLDIKKSHKAPIDKLYHPLTNIHIEKRRLLLCEVQALTSWYKDNPLQQHPIVLYTGSARGSELILLSQMFPSVFFVLYDGTEFDKKLRELPDAFELHKVKVTTDVISGLAQRFSKMTERLIFICDMDFGIDTEKDMNLQEEWMRLLNPAMSLLKFRLPRKENMLYPKGVILYDVWSKDDSLDSRILIQNKHILKKISYDSDAYEQSMFFHIKFARPFCYLKESRDMELQQYIYQDNNAYCPCYDCIAELKILQEYASVMRADFGGVIHQFGAFMNPLKKPLHFQRNAKLKMNPVPEPRFVQFVRK